MAPFLQLNDRAATLTHAGLNALIAAALAVAVRVEDALTAQALLASRGLPRSWHEAWLDTADAVGRSDVPDLTGGRWPTSCSDRHEWHLATAQGARRTTTWCTRPAFHEGRHAQGQLVDGADGTVLRGRVVAVWEYPS